MGPAKGKDYANSMGPVIVTMDEPRRYAVDGDPRVLIWRQNFTETENSIRENNTKSIYHSYGDMIAHASRETAVYPGDVLGSGTIGGGAFGILRRPSLLSVPVM